MFTIISDKTHAECPTWQAQSFHDSWQLPSLMLSYIFFLTPQPDGVNRFQDKTLFKKIKELKKSFIAQL